jgi:hypothetical protein
MKFIKGYRWFMPILLISYLLISTNVIADGPWKGDDFDSYPIGALAPPTNGWQSLNNKTWSITYGVLTGKVLWFTPNDRDFFVHPSDTSDHEISVQIQHSLIPNNSYNAGLVGRCSDRYSYYSSYIYTNIQGNNHTTRLVLAKYWKIGSTTYAVILKNIHCFSGAINPDMYYTLSMKVNGSDITSTLYFSSPAIPPVSVSHTDDGITYGPVLTGGYVGVYSDAEVSFHPYFDNFTYVNTGCSGDVVVLQNMTFTSGNTYNCTATSSITTGTGVTVQSGATVNFSAPIINLQPGFNVESGAVFSVKQ